MPLRRALTAMLLASTLLLLPACSSSSDNASTSMNASASPTSSAERQHLAKTRFVANVGLAAGATYQWIVKPYRNGTFKKGANGRTFALVKAGLAGAFTYNRLKHALVNAKGDPTLSKLVVPLSAGIAALRGLPSKLRKGEGTDQITSQFNSTVDQVKSAAKSAGVNVTDQVPSLSQLKNG